MIWVSLQVYTVGPLFAHAEARKSPSVDGVVCRSADGQSSRYSQQLLGHRCLRFSVSFPAGTHEALSPPPDTACRCVHARPHYCLCLLSLPISASASPPFISLSPCKPLKELLLPPSPLFRRLYVFRHCHVVHGFLPCLLSVPSCVLVPFLGKEVRYPVILTEIEKCIAFKLVRAFQQVVCG